MAQDFSLLMRALKFTKDDLDANRQGEFSESQRKSMQMQIEALTALTLVSLVVMILALAFLTPHFDGKAGSISVILILVGVCGLFALLTVMTVPGLNRDLETGTVLMAEGKAEFDYRPGLKFDSCFVIVAGQKFQISKAVYESFMPYTYRLYYAPSARKLLSAELIDNNTTVSSMNDTQTTLMELFDFTADDLEANHRGVLSTQQQERLITYPVGSPIIAEFIVVLCLIGILLVLLTISPAVGIGLIGIVIMIALLIVRIQTMPKAIQDGRVRYVEGKATVQQLDKGPYILHIGDQKFVLHGGGYNMFQPGEYRAFYSPHAKSLMLSVEPLTIPAPFRLEDPLEPDYPRLALAALFHFTDDDLTANRQGHLSQRQLSRLKNNQLWPVVVPVSLMAAITLVLALPIQPAPFGIAALLIVGLIATSAFAIRMSLPLNRDMVAGDLFKAEGQPEFHKSGWIPRIYSLSIDHHTFRVSMVAQLAFADGSKYRLFYTPQTKIIMSAEQIDIDNSCEQIIREDRPT